MRAAEDSTIPIPTAPEVAGRVVVELKGIRKSFGENEVLKGVDLSVHAGEHVVIFGPSGSGKSTLLRTINMLEPPTSGSVKVDGKEYARGGSAIELRRTVGMVFQQFNLFPHLTALENITLPLRRVKGVKRNAAEERAAHALHRVGLIRHAAHFPREMSGGQQRRVAIAGALALDPKVMLFDEPTSALDPELVGEVLGVMRSLAAAGQTMLLVTHEAHFAREAAGRVIFRDEGQVIEEGPASDVLVSPRHAR